MVRTESVTFEYDANNHFTFPDLTVKEGGNLLILGASGVGKTTLLHLIAGLLRPKSGKIIIGKTTITNLPNRRMDAFRGANIGLVFQRPFFIQSLTVGENLDLIRFLAKRPQIPDYQREVLFQLGLSRKLKCYPRHLSIGEQQRLAIGIVLINRPKLILADEPTSALDDKNCSKVVELLKNQTKNTNSNLIIITHDQRLKSSFNTSLNLT